MPVICCAEQVGKENSGNGKPLEVNPQRKQLSSVSTALLLALGIGTFEALALFFGSGTFLHVMGVSKVCFYLNSDCSIIVGLSCFLCYCIFCIIG